MFFILYFIGTALFTDTIFNINIRVYIVSSSFYLKPMRWTYVNLRMNWTYVTFV